MWRIACLYIVAISVVRGGLSVEMSPVERVRPPEREGGGG